MSNINISLSANTAAYVKRIKDARTETDRNIIKMEQRIDQFAQDVNKNFTSVGGAIDTMLGGLRNIKGGGYIAAVAGIGYAAGSAAVGMKQLATETATSQMELKKAAERSRVSVKEMQALAAVSSTVGIDMEKLGDIYKDTFDKLGDYITTGGGAFVDFFDVVKGKSTVTAQELQRLSGPEVMQKVVDEMEKAGASGSQMTFVLESIGSDASDLLPLLRNGAKEFKALQERMDEVSKTPLLIKEAEQEVHVLNTAFSSMWDSFGVMMTNKMEGTFGWMTKIATYANNMFNEAAIEDMGKKFASGLSKREHSINADSSVHTLRQEQEAIKQWIEKNQKSGVSPETQRALAQAERKYSELNGKTTSYGGYKYKEQADAQAKIVEELKAKVKAEQEDFKKYTEGLLKSYDNAIDSKAGQTKGGGGTGKEMLDRIEKVDNGMKAEDAADEMKKAKEQELAIQKDILKQKEDIAAYEAKIALEKDDKVKASMLENLATQKRVLEDSGKLLEAYKTRQENITKDQDKEAQKKVDDAKKVSDAKTREGEKALREAERLKREEMATQINYYQQEVNSALTASERVVAVKNLEMERIRQLKETGKINDEQERELTILAQQKEFEAQLALKDEHFASDFERDMAHAEAKKEWVLGQFADGQITEEQFREMDLQAERDYTNAKNALTQSRLDMLSDAMSGLSGLFEQGSSAQKVAFAAEKGVAIAQGVLMMEQNALKAKAAAMATATGPAAIAAGETASLMSRIKDGASIAAMSAAAIGQFHSGTDEVDQTGSYILKKGERVVQETANKDLTAFLEGNKGTSGEIKIDAPMNIQGDANIDENKFKAMLVQHRENITQAVKLAQRENPSLR